METFCVKVMASQSSLLYNKLCMYRSNSETNTCQVTHNLYYNTRYLCTYYLNDYLCIYDDHWLFTLVLSFL